MTRRVAEIDSADEDILRRGRRRLARMEPGRSLMASQPVEFEI